jgi:hypothetical protein
MHSLLLAINKKLFASLILFIDEYNFVKQLIFTGAVDLNHYSGTSTVKN